LTELKQEINAEESRQTPCEKNSPNQGNESLTAADIEAITKAVLARLEKSRY
jgi:hypothetical protein